MNLFNLILLGSLLGCALHTNKKPEVSSSAGSRYLASVDENLFRSTKFENELDILLEGVFHSYLLGQVHLYDFDQQLDKDPSHVLKSDAYNSLLAVRQFVDHFEEQIEKMYIQMAVISALPKFNIQDKEKAQITLDRFGHFFNGILSDREELPENLRPLILSSLRIKKTQLSKTLELLKNDPFINKSDESKKIFHRNSVYLRATQMQYDYQNLKDYKVDKKILLATIGKEKNKKNFKILEKQIRDLSIKMKEFTSQLDRGTSTNEIYPSTGPNGNISGRTFPENTWSLTFDDGPGGKSTKDILKNLKDKNIKATFFMLAEKVQSRFSTALEIKNDGHDLASHSFTHAQLTKVGAEQLEREVGAAKTVIENKLSTKIKLFRLPYGAGTGNSSIRSKIAEHKMVHVFWTVDTLDWQDKNPQSIYERALKQMKASAKNSGIILFHDIHQQTVTASSMVMDYINQNKLSACTVQGVVDQINNGLPDCK